MYSSSTLVTHSFLPYHCSLSLSLRAEGVAISVVGCFWRLLRHFVPRNDKGKGLLAMTQETTRACSQLKVEDTLIL